MLLSKKVVIPLLIFSVAVSAWGINAVFTDDNQTKVGGSQRDSAVDFAEKVISSAQNRKGREFISLAENPAMREPLKESFMFLNQVKLAPDPDWEVVRTKDGNMVNVNFELSSGRRAVVVLRPAGNTYKFVYAMTAI